MLKKIERSGMHVWLEKQRELAANPNPFAEYMRFSADTQQGPAKQVKKLEIFFFFQVRPF